MNLVATSIRSEPIMRERGTLAQKNGSDLKFSTVKRARNRFR